MFVCSALLTTLVAEQSPFTVQFEDKEELSDQDYLDLQKLLRIKKKELAPLIHQIYPRDREGYTTFDDFYENRCSRSLGQVLIDPEKGYFPLKRLEKIGEGSDMCFVSCAPYDGVRSTLIRSLPNALRDCGFHGYFYYRIGGIPNPTGQEVKYAGVPYAFKIFLMLEAYKLGFKNVIWLDSALFPLQDPTFLFRWLVRRGSFIDGVSVTPNLWRYIFPKTREKLQEVTGVDVLSPHTTYIRTTLFGLRMDHPLVQRLISDYYDLVELGTPFLSCFPEEFVLTAIMGKPEYAPLISAPIELLFRSFDGDDEAKAHEQLRKEGYLFHLRKH